jgi:hypothetical protein
MSMLKRKFIFYLLSVVVLIEYSAEFRRAFRFISGTHSDSIRAPSNRSRPIAG